MEKNDLSQFIRDIPDFPKEGIIFKDITPLLQNGKAFATAIQLLADAYKSQQIDTVVAVESRGFIFGAAVALQLQCGFVPVRKKGKLPYQTDSVTYDLEYGTDTLEIHKDAIRAGSKVLIVDDLLATGGTVKATAELIQKQGGKIAGAAFLIELAFLKGREKLADIPIVRLIEY